MKGHRVMVRAAALRGSGRVPADRAIFRHLGAQHRAQEFHDRLRTGLPPPSGIELTNSRIHRGPRHSLTSHPAGHAKPG